MRTGWFWERIYGETTLRWGNAMSAIVIPCPGCRAPLTITPDLVGKTIACPACQQPIQLAGSPAPAKPQPAPQPAFARAAATGGADPQAAVSQYQRKRNSIGLAILVSWGVVACLLVAAAALVFVLRMRALAERETAGVNSEPLQPAITEPHQPPAPSIGSQKEIPRQRDPTPEVSATPKAPIVEQTPPQSVPLRPKQPILRPAPGSAAQPPSFPANSRTPPSIVPAPSPPASAPPAPADPLAGLADVWRLPALISTEPERMATLSKSPTEPLRISIHSLAADVATSGAIFAESTAGGWGVYYVSDLATGADRVTLGTIQQEGLDFVFEWTEPLADAALRRQLSNCLIELRHGNSIKTAQLREPTRAGVLTFNLEQGVQTAEFQIPDLPRSDTLRLEIRELAGFPSDVALREEMKSISPGKRAVIQFTGTPGAEIGVQLIKLAGGGLVLRTESEFRENSATKFEMSLSRLGALQEGVSKALEKAKRELPGERAQLASLQDDLEDAQRSRAGNIQEAAVRDRLIASLAGKVKRSVNKVKLLQKQIVEGEARLAAVPKIRSFLDSLHQRAQLRFAICAECGERDVLLVDGTQSAAGAE